MSTATQTARPRINLSVSESAMNKQPEVKIGPAQATGPGPSGMARQGDIIELNRRLGEKLAKLPQEIAEQFGPAQAAANARIDKVEARLEALGASLDGLEGALRIELAPYLGAAVSEAIRDNAVDRPRRRGIFWVLLAMLAGLAAGTVFHDRIQSYATEARVTLSSFLASGKGH